MCKTEKKKKKTDVLIKLIKAETMRKEDDFFPPLSVGSLRFVHLLSFPVLILRV